MTTLLKHHRDLWPITSAVLPKDFQSLMTDLSLKADSSGLKLMSAGAEVKTLLPRVSGEITPVMHKIQDEYQFRNLRIYWSSERLGFVMNRGQAAAYLQSEILQPEFKGPCTIWIPFVDGEEEDSVAQFIIRIYRREDASTEVFFYSVHELDRWEHKGDFFVALGKYNLP